MKIAHIILISFSIILLLFTISTYINFRQAELINDNENKFDHSSGVIENSNRFQRNFLNMVSGLRGYLLTDEESFIQTYDSARAENTEIINKLNSILPDGSDQKILLHEIGELQGYWIDEFASPLLKAKETAKKSVQDKQVFDKLYSKKLISKLDKDVQKSLQRKFSELISLEYVSRASNRESLSASINQTRNITIFLTSISIGLGVCVALFIAYYISSRILTMVKMANAIADGDYDVSIPEFNQNELGLLSQSLNAMAQTLATNISLLKRQKNEVDQFAHIVSHDLRAPLRGIDNVVTWIEDDYVSELPSKVTEYLSIIKERISRAEKLLNAVLQYAKAGREAVPKELVNINQLLVEIKNDLSKDNLTRIIIRSNMPIIYTQRIPLFQVFSNLIHNAIKYHDKPDGFVKIYWKKEGSYYRFFIHDNGPGINPTYHKKIFTLFQTLQQKETKDSMGIGLAIVKKILDDRHLSIHLSSVPGKGSIFSFNWPQA